MTVAARIANRAWRAANWRDARAFARAVHNPAAAQAAKLRGYLATNAQSAFSREHGLTAATTMDVFRERVPVRDYSGFEPYIERVAAGEPSVLTAAPVEMFTPTSGSTGAEKLIPRTAALRGEFAAALAPWLNGVFSARPATLDGPAYWSVSPVGPSSVRRHGAVTIGFGDDDEYLSRAGRVLAGAVRAVPTTFARAESVTNWRYLTLLALLRSPTLAMVSVWHPSFFELLLDALPRWWERLCADVAAGTASLPEPGGGDDRLATTSRRDHKRASELSTVSPTDVRGIWPRLTLVSCWADGAAAVHARALGDRLDGVAADSKGLLATEAFVSIPWDGLHPVAVRSHFFEFEKEDGTVCLVNELQQGDVAVPIITTGGGLWRYRLPDRVVVDGFAGATPSLRFLGRVDAVSDLRGEKLCDAFVGVVLGKCCTMLESPPRISVLAPLEAGDRAGYVWYVDARAQVESVACELDRLLCENPHYAYARRLEQLQPPRVVTVNAAAARGVLDAEQGRARVPATGKPVFLCRQRTVAHALHGLCGGGKAAPATIPAT